MPFFILLQIKSSREKKSYYCIRFIVILVLVIMIVVADKDN